MEKLELNLFLLEENGEAEVEETMDGSPAIQTSNSPFEAFSIRNYVAGIRKVAIKKCWPFSPQFLESKLQKGVDNVLPPLEVLTCRYWGCTDCVESVNDNPGKLNQERNADTQLDNIQSDPPIQNGGYVFTRELEKEECFSDVMEISDVEAIPENILKKDEGDRKEKEEYFSDDMETSDVEATPEDILKKDEADRKEKEEYFSDDMETSDKEAMPEDILKKDEADQKENEEYFSDDMETSDIEATPEDILKKDEADQTKVTSHVSADIGSEEAPVVCNERTFHSRDNGAEDATMAQLEGNEILLNLTENALHESCSGSKTVVCKLTSKTIECELIVPSCQSVSANSKEQVFDDEVASEIKAEAYMQGLNVAVNAEVFPHANVTTDFMVKYRTVNRSHHENEDDIATENERDHIINDNPDNRSHHENEDDIATENERGNIINDNPHNRSHHENEDDIAKENERDHIINDSPHNTPFTSTSGNNIDLDDSPTQLSSKIDNEEVILKTKKTEYKQQKENGKTQKKRFIADLIATAPSKQIRGDDEDQNWASTDTPRKERIGTWKQKSVRSQKTFKDAMHGLKELKVKRNAISEVPFASILTNFVAEKSDPESLEVTRKRQRLLHGDVSPTTRDVPQRLETSSADEEEIVTNSSGRPPTEDLARGLMKRKLVQNFLPDEIQKAKTSVESDDDLMDLAGFLAQKQLERISSLPSSGLPKGKRVRRFKKYPTQHKPNHVLRHKTEQLSDQVELQPNIFSMEGLVTRQDAFHNNPNQVVSENGHPSLLVEQGPQQLTKLCDSLVPEELDVSRQGQRKGTSTAKKDGTVSVSKDHSNFMRKPCEKNLGHVGKFAAPVMMEQQMYRGYSTIRRKKSEAHDSKKSNASPEHDHGSIPSQAVSEHGHLYLSAESKCQQINQLPDSYMREKSIMSEQTKGMRSCPDLQKKSEIIVKDGERNFGNRSEHPSLFTRKEGNNKRQGASKRLKSDTQKPLKKPKLYSEHDLAEEQNTSTNISAKEIPHDDCLHLGSGGGCQQRNQVEVSLVSQGLNVSGQATKERTNSTRKEVFSSSNVYFDNRRRATAKTSGHRRKTLNFVAMKGTKEKGSSASQRKPIAASKSCYGIASGSENVSGTIPKTGKENIVLTSELVSAAAIKQGKRSSTSKKKKSGAYMSIDGTNLSPNHGIRREVARNCNLTGFGSEDAQTDPIAGEGQQMNSDEGYILPENTVMAGGDDGTETFSEIRDLAILHSRDCLDIPMRIGDEKSGYKHKAGSCVIMRKQKDKGSSRSQRKKSTGHKSRKELKALAKTAGRQMSIIEETNAALNAAFSDRNGSKPPFVGTVIRGNGYCPERNPNLRSCKFIPSETVKPVTTKVFAPQQTLIQPSVAPTVKDRELLIINDNSVQLTLNSEGLIADSRKMHHKTLESENSNKKDNNLNQRTNGLKSVSAKVVYASVCEPEAEPQHPSMDVFTKQTMQFIDRKLLNRNADAELVVKNQDALGHGNSLVQRHGNAFPNGKKQSSSNATCLPVKGFLGPKISQHEPNGSDSCNSLGYLLPYVTLATPVVESASEFDQCRSPPLPSDCSTVFGVAQGNQVDIPSKSSQETFCHGNYDLNSYIQERIKAHRSNCTSGYEGFKRNASAAMDTAARNQSDPDKTISKNMLRSSSQVRTRTGFEALDSDPLKQKLVVTMTSPGKFEMIQRIERSPCINVFTNTRQVSQVNQNLQPEILPLSKNDSVEKIKDSTSKRTLQRECVEPETIVDSKNLMIGLTPNILKHQNFGRKPAIMTRNVTDLVETERWEADTSKHRFTCTHDSARPGLTAQSHTSLTPTLLKPLKLAPGRKHCLNMPAQKTIQHRPIYSTFPSMQESIGGKYFQDGPLAYTDQYGRLARTSDKPFQMEARAHCNFSNASESVLAASPPENVKPEDAKDLYGRADINCFPGPAIRGDELLGGASDKEGSVLTNICKDNPLDLSLSIQQGS